MAEFFGTPGYPTLFLVSFLAASLLPLGSEWLLTAMLCQGFPAWPVVAVATTGNYLGACTTYLVGIHGGPLLTGKVLRIDAPSRQRAENLFRRYGVWSLLFSWLPLIGDPLCLVGGVFRVPFPHFSMLVIIGKLGRYATLAALIAGGRQALGL